MAAVKSQVKARGAEKFALDDDIKAYFTYIPFIGIIDKNPLT